MTPFILQESPIPGFRKGVRRRLKLLIYFWIVFLSVMVCFLLPIINSYGHNLAWGAGKSLLKPWEQLKRWLLDDLRKSEKNAGFSQSTSMPWLAVYFSLPTAWIPFEIISWSNLMRPAILPLSPVLCSSLSPRDSTILENCSMSAGRKTELLINSSWHS